MHQLVRTLFLFYTPVRIIYMNSALVENRFEYIGTFRTANLSFYGDFSYFVRIDKIIFEI